MGRSILLALAYSSDPHGCSWASQGVIAAHAQCSKRTVSRHLRIFQERGLVRVVERCGYHGGRISCVYILVGWAGRKLIPQAGHPRLGPAIREDALSRARHHILTQESHRGTDSAADQNKTNEIKKEDTTTALEAEKIQERCLEALGPWADDANRACLGKDRSGPLQLIEVYDLEKHILPVLSEKSSKGFKAPPLRTWRYFQEPIQDRAEQMAADAFRPGIVQDVTRTVASARKRIVPKGGHL